MDRYRGRCDMMAVEATAEIVSKKLETLLSRPGWVGCLLMETLVKDAKANLALIQEFLSTGGRPLNRTEWSERLLRAMYDAEDILDEFHGKVACGRHKALCAATRPLATLVHKSVLWRDLSNVVKILKELCQDQYLTDKKDAGGERKKKPASSSSHASALWEGQKPARLSNFWERQASMTFLCHETKKEDIKKRIRMESEGVHLNSIWGEQGAGKTFIARWVYREAMYLGFETRAWVPVSAINDQREFLFEILKQVDRQARDVMHLYEIEKRLYNELARTKRFLVVLDDVRLSDVDLLKRLISVTPFHSHGHIITTTQDNKIAEVTEIGGAIRLGNLSHEDSRRMLAMKLHRGPHVPKVTPEEDKILNRFPALPLCISLLGGLLSYAKEHERIALANDDSKMSVSDLLELSYHRLPVHLKPCFIYMALFPRASPILTRRLVRLWLAEGLLDMHFYEGEREKTPEEVGETFILELADKNVIDVVSWRVDGFPKACQMLTSVYDLICLTTVSTGFLHIHGASKSKDRNDCTPTGQQQWLPAQSPDRARVRWLAEHTNIVKDGSGGSYPALNLDHVRSFLSFNLRRGLLTKDISKFLRKLTSKTDYGLLRVLDLEGVYRPSLQGVLHKLVLLRYLGLRSTLLDLIPREVADLHYLETLDIKHTNIASLPSSLWKARNLRHLHLNCFYINLKKILKARGASVMALTKLQTLSGLVVGEVKENSTTALRNSLTALTTLKLFLQLSDNDTSDAAGKTVANWISFGLTNLQSLTFGVIQGAEPAEEAESAEEAEPAEEAESVEEVKPAKEATKVDKPDKEDKPAKEAMKKAERSEGAKPKRSQIGPLPELSLADQHHDLLELYLLGQLNRPSWKRLLPVSLKVLTLSGSRVEADMMPKLGGLLKNLRTLRLLANSFLGTRLRFIKDKFPSLKVLKIWKLPRLQEVIIEQGAMLQLKELEFRHLKRLKIVEGINECKELENIRVISQTEALVNQLAGQIGEETNLLVQDDERPFLSTNDDED